LLILALLNILIFYKRNNNVRAPNPALCVVVTFIVGPCREIILRRSPRVHNALRPKYVLDAKLGKGGRIGLKKLCGMC
jgi:hypothetical protein